MKKEYDITIIGGGIAGITIAEIFSRNGYKVCLIEKNKSLCKETSGSHHGWFHFGSLYSIFPGKRFLRSPALLRARSPRLHPRAWFRPSAVGLTSAAGTTVLRWQGPAWRSAAA